MNLNTKQVLILMNPIHNIHDKSVFIEIPVADESETKIAQINWIQLLEEPFYVAGITFTENPDNDPYNGGSSEWILRKDIVVGLKALMCNLYWNKEQSDEIKESQAFLDIDFSYETYLEEE